MVKQRTFILALAAALLLVLLVGSVAFADGPTSPTAQTEEKAAVCVDGYVINHRELAVDGTKTIPPLVVEAVQAGTNGGPNQVVATAPVGKDGYFKLSIPEEGTYNITMALPAGWEGIVPAARLSTGEDSSAAETGFTEFDASDKCYRIVFKIRRLVTISVLKWEEQLDGTVIPGEDWLITATPIKDPFAKVVTATITGGQALITLTPGQWTVAETVKNGWTPLTPASVTRIVDQYQGTGAINPIVFKNREPACHPSITVTKVGYGTNNLGERENLGTLAGWKFTVSRADGTAPSITKTTGGDGTALFDNLLPGVYKVTETVQTGWEVLTDNPTTVVLMDCEEIGVTFENRESIGDLRIYGTKWFQAWEKPYKGTVIGLAGWAITATLVGVDDTSATTVTDALGNYEFTEEQLRGAGMAFPGASIKVCEEERDHWIAKSPVCVTVKFPYPVPPEYTGVKVDFTNFQDPPPGGATYSAPVSSGSCSTYYVVKSGDTVAKVAGKFGVSGSSLIRTNGIKNANLIYLGQRLCIP